jgi:hypothetical protein
MSTRTIGLLIEDNSDEAQIGAQVDTLLDSVEALRFQIEKKEIARRDHKPLGRFVRFVRLTGQTETADLDKPARDDLRSELIDAIKATAA